MKRFWDKVNKTSTCWLWTSAVTNKGYGSFRVNGRRGRSVSAHRMSWILKRGEIPGALCVLHKCDTPLCVRPSHLFLGDRLTNARDRDQKRRARWHKNKDFALKFSAAQVREMRRLYSAGEEIEYIMTRFRVSRAHLWKIIARKMRPFA